MNGIDKITAKINADMDQEIAQLQEKSRQQCETIQADGRAQAQQIQEEILRRGRKASAERLERLKSAAQMETRKQRLAAKQEVVGEAFDLALEKLCSLPEEEYIALLTSLALRASTTGREKLIFSQKDRAQIGKKVVVAANDALVKQVSPELPGSISESKVGAFLGKVVNSTTAIVTGTGLLTLSEETRDIKGGFIMVDGSVEINCSFEMLIRLQREKLEKEVAQLLFP